MRSRFVVPTVEEIQAYIQEAGISNVDALDFFLHYEAQGWLLGSNKPMACWRATVRMWSRRAGKYKKK